jgi:hypothetical protein
MKDGPASSSVWNGPYSGSVGHVGPGVVMQHDDTSREHAGTLSLDGGGFHKSAYSPMNFGWFATLGTKELNESS